MKALDIVRNWWHAPRQLRTALEQLAQNRSVMGQLLESYRVVRQDADAMKFYADPDNRRMLRERNQVSDDVDRFFIAGAGPQMEGVNIREAANVPAKLREQLGALDLALEDRGWIRQIALSQVEFSRYGLQQIMLFSRLYFIKNPLIRRGVLVSSYYTFGRGVEITSDNEAADELIQDFLRDNAKELGQGGLVEKDQCLHTDGNLYFTFFLDEGTGNVKVRTIDALEIANIVTNPDDVSDPQYYLRRWQPRGIDPVTGYLSQGQAEAYYPAINFEAVPATFGDRPVRQEPIFHMKSGGLSKWLYGLSEVYSALAWAGAVKDYLEDWLSMNRSLARFAWNLETKGGQQAVEQFQKVISTGLGIGGTSAETNPPPVTGSTFITGPGNKLEPIKTSGATSNPEQGRRILLMVAAAFGLPETFFGDASTGSLATAVSLDRPTELKFMARQEQWREALQTIIGFVVTKSLTAPGGKLREACVNGHTPRVIFMRPVRKDHGVTIWEAEQPPKQGDIVINIKFPSVLEHDVNQRVSAIIQAATLGGFTCAGTMDMKTVALQLMHELGIEDPEVVFDAMYQDYDPTEFANDPTADAALAAQQDTPPPRITKPGMSEARLLAAVEQLRNASNKLLALKG